MLRSVYRLPHLGSIPAFNVMIERSHRYLKLLAVNVRVAEVYFKDQKIKKHYMTSMILTEAAAAAPGDDHIATFGWEFFVNTRSVDSFTVSCALWSSL